MARPHNRAGVGGGLISLGWKSPKRGVDSHAIPSPVVQKWDVTPVPAELAYRARLVSSIQYQFPKRSRAAPRRSASVGGLSRGAGVNWNRRDCKVSSERS